MFADLVGFCPSQIREVLLGRPRGRHASWLTELFEEEARARHRTQRG